MEQQAQVPSYSYGVVNGKLVRKYTLQVEIYPDIEDQVKRMIKGVSHD